MNNCLLCTNKVTIPSFLNKEYKEIGVDDSTGYVCSLTRKAINIFNNGCNNFTKQEYE